MLPPVVRRFVAGESAAAALDHARRNDEQGVGTILNLLGEHYTSRSRAAEDAAAYRQLVADVGATDLRACISVKPTQLGLSVGEECFREHVDAVVEAAEAADVFVWLDMEHHGTVDATIEAYEDHAGAGRDVGICLQSNLRRTHEDLERLADYPGKVRLVKGAYSPPADVAYSSSERVNRAYREDLRFVFEAFEDGIAVGSHDPAMIDLAASLHEEHGTPYEIQFLMGVRDEALVELGQDHEVWEYAPYGTSWPSYFYRRVTERAENATFAVRALLGG